MQQNNISVSQPPPPPPPPTAAATTTTTTTQPPTSNGNPNAIDQAQFETDKRAVYKHPLFSLLALMLEKCEQATQGYVSTSSSQSNSSSPNGTPNGNCENDSFSRDIHAFVHLLEKEKGPLLTNDPELDGLMIKALQVLRIHLLELEKVQELCRDFCTRYIACLRGKMHSENLLRTDYPFESNNNLSNSNSPVNSPEQRPEDTKTQHDSLTTQSGGYYGTADFLTGNDGNEFNNLPGAYNNLHINNNATAENNYNNHINHNNINNLNNNNNNNIIINNNNATVRMTSSQTIPPLTSSSQLQSSAGIQSPQLQHQHQQQLSPHNNHNNHNNNSNNNNNNNNNINSNQHQQQNSIMSSQILGSTPLSQIGCPPLSLDQYQNQLSPCGGGGCSSDELDSEIDSNNDDLSSNFSNNSGSKRQKRGILPKQATSVMRAWLFQHLVHPYPTEDEKRSIAAQTNLTLLQVNNWFINARRRILQPMLEHANDNTQNNSARKKSTSQTPSKRFWTDNVQTQNMNPSMIDPNIENISVNINRADSERSSNSNISNKLLTADNYYSDESNDSLVIDHDS